MQMNDVRINSLNLFNKIPGRLCGSKTVKIEQAGFEGVQTKIPGITNADGFRAAWAMAPTKGNMAFVALLHNHLSNIFSYTTSATGI